MLTISLGSLQCGGDLHQKSSGVGEDNKDQNNQIKQREKGVTKTKETKRTRRETTRLRKKIKMKENTERNLTNKGEIDKENQRLNIRRLQ